MDADLHAELAKHSWFLHSEGYAWRSIGPRDRKTLIYLHRAVLGIAPSEPGLVDHVNRDRLDNRRENLRVADHSANGQNRGGAPANSSTGVRGVSWHGLTGKYQVQATVRGRRYSGGLHASLAEAEQAAVALRQRVMPFSEADRAVA